MEKKTMHMTFASSLSDICSMNASFDSGVLKICYPGENRNGTYFAKEDLVRCIPTMYNCPVVCNYDRETDTLGGHDMEFVETDGGYKLVNKTVPVGVIPESAKYWFEECEEDDGTKHEYLFVNALIWKRQEAYEKIKRDGITSQSMEISVKDGERIDGLYHIRDFEFTAFTLIGIEPCFEGASLTMENYSVNEELKRELSEMMADLKDSYSLLVTAPGEKPGDDNIPTHNITTEGGDRNLDEKLKLLEEFGKKPEDLDFSIDELSVEELREKLRVFDDDPEDPDADGNDDKDDDAGDDETGGDEGDDDAPAAEDDGDDDTAPVTNPARIGNPKKAYELSGNMRQWLYEAVCALGTFTDSWGDVMPVYWMLDYDADAGMVYCESNEDWKIYGFSYEMNGDKVEIDAGSKKRMKREYVAFEGEDAAAAPSAMYSAMAEKINGIMKKDGETISYMEAELADLRKFKADIENAKAEEAREAVYGRFGDLAGNEAFESLKEHAAEFSIEALEEKCYAIRGRSVSVAKFNYEPKMPKLVVDKTANGDGEWNKVPYDGIVERYR